MLEANDVIHLAAVKSILFCNQAILAQEICARCHHLTQLCAYPSTHLPSSDGRVPSPNASSAQFASNGLALIFPPLIALRSSLERLNPRPALWLPQMDEKQ